MTFSIVIMVGRGYFLPTHVHEASKILTLGRTLGGYVRGPLTKTKEMLDDMHKRKIDMADEIFVINVGGYIGSSTRSEIEYVEATGKAVRYLEA